jgi:MerR family redox-sensitive transcriptional activator SoxR
MRDLDIGEVAERSGVPASTLRYYEEKGLVASTGRRGLRRLFDPGVLERLALIALAEIFGVRVRTTNFALAISRNSA